MTAPFEGGCRCGAIRYTCSAEPLVSAAHIWTDSAPPWACMTQGLASFPGELPTA